MIAAFPLLILSTVFTSYATMGCANVSRHPVQRALSIGSAATENPFWLQEITHQGTAAYNPNAATYQVFRNVKDFGAVGDGVTDDTAAINKAISSGGRCGGGLSNSCRSSTVFPAIVYFPSGTYLISNAIVPYYYTQLIGDAKNLPTLLAAPSFNDIAVIDLNPYLAGGAQWFDNQNTFFRSIRNFVIDVRQVPFDKSQGTGIHWQVAQATSLMNIVVEMSTQPGTAHQGIWMENGSGGFMGDLVFNGGKFGMWVGNQQFTVRNVTINNAETGVFGVWNWGWTFQGITINNCQVGFDITTGGPVATEAIIDVVVKDTPVFLRTSTASTGVLASSGSLVLKNIRLDSVPTAVGVAGGAVVLAGSTGTMTIDSWGQGNVYTGTNSAGTFTQGDLPSASIPGSLLDSTGRVVGRGHPQYEEYSVDQFVSVKDCGAVGDGFTDDTDALQEILNEYVGSKIIFFDAGTYIVTSTITIPAGSRIVGEAWSVIAGQGSHFEDQSNPQVVVRVGEKGSQGIMEITDIVFSTVGPAAGAIVVEWNIKEDHGDQAGAGMWDSHIRLGGAAGTNLELATCPTTSIDTSSCTAAFLALHLTTHSTAYLEGTWVWLADHDLDGDGKSQLNIFAGRGILSESQGPVWMIGTAEHFVLYQYNLVNAQNHYMGLIQTEAPYFQPVPPAPAPFSINSAFNDPYFPSDVTTAWALTVKSSSDIFIFGAGLYSFFQNYQKSCEDDASCQTQIVDIDSESSVHIYSLSTIAAAYQISVDHQGVVNQSSNANGFPSTVTFWKSS